MAQWVKAQLIILAFCVGTQVLTALFLIAACCSVWESNQKWPKYLDHFTYVGVLDSQHLNHFKKEKKKI